MKTLWRGGISFGLVNIPVRLYSGAVSQRIDLDMIRKKDQCAIQYVRVCKKDGKEVPWEEIAKGYRRENGDYIVLDRDEISKLMPGKSDTIDIFEFVLEKDIPAQFLEKPYIIEPEKAATKTYALLRDALKKTGKVGLCRFVMRTSEHLGILKVEEDVILLIQIRFQEELRDHNEVKTPGKLKIEKKELDMAVSIINQLTGTFEPEKYKDTYKADLIKLIKKKASAKPKKEPVTPQRTRTKKSDNLLEQLKASLAAIKN